MVGIKFKDRFKELREQNGYTQITFLKAINADEYVTSIESVRNWEQGKSIPEWRTILKLCDFFDCDMDYLFGRISKKTHDTQFICNEIGLSEEALMNLIDKVKTPCVLDFLSELFSASPDLLENLAERFCTYRDRLNSGIHLLNSIQELVVQQSDSSHKKDAKLLNKIKRIPPYSDYIDDANDIARFELYRAIAKLIDNYSEELKNAEK